MSGPVPPIAIGVTTCKPYSPFLCLSDHRQASIPRFVQLATSYIIYTMADRRAELLSVQISMAAVAVFAVALRLITRFLILKCPGWDDYIIILGMCLGLAQTVLTLSCLPYGAAKHMIDITSRTDLLYVLKVGTSCQGQLPFRSGNN